MSFKWLALLTVACTWPAARAASENSTFEQACLAFNPQSYVLNSTLRILEYVPAGTNLPLTGNDATCTRTNQTAANNLCRVALTVPTSNRSSLIYEHWFPEVWSGRFLATGNGGTDGCIKYEELAYGAQYGFATAGTNNGHNGSSGVTFLNNPDVVEDYASRSLHASAQAGKTLTDAFYGETHNRSYYIGCSGGGRQGIKSAEAHPDGEFDGIVAGSPGVGFNDLYSWRGRFLTVTGAVNSPNFITADMWINLIHNEVLRQCDDIDGVVDGIITDPDLCHFDPSTIACSNSSCTAASNSSCLNPTQVDIVNTIFSPYTYPNGTLIFPGANPGSEILASGGLYSGLPFTYSQEWFRYVVLSDPTWDPATYNLSDTILANELNPFDVQTYPSDLSAFRDSGSKMISYHGRQDQQISSFNTERFYKHLQAGMNATSADLDEFWRFFRIPGMSHCLNGPGAWVFGETGGGAAAGIPFEPSRNVLAAVVAWVENGTAPDTITGTKFVNDTVSLGVDFMREHCRYPLRSTYVGGDPKDVASWVCQDVATDAKAV